MEFSRMFRDKKILINGKPVTEEEFFKKYPTVHMPPEIRVLDDVTVDFEITRYEFNIKKVKQWHDPRRNDTLIVFPEEVKIVSKAEALFHPDTRGFGMKTLAAL
ncbi:MAG: hypothetical protein KBT06_04325 [Prevotellaceae bacterium]|nr:hypothetical protein [Candidatus Colivivens equi]